VPWELLELDEEGGGPVPRVAGSWAGWARSRVAELATGGSGRVLLGRVLDVPPAVVFGVYLRRVFWGADSPPGLRGFLPVYGTDGQPLFGVHAMLATGISMGLRLSHYRDHLYSELGAARELVGLAKAMGGDRAAIGYGRGAPHSVEEIVRGGVVVRLRDPGRPEDVIDGLGGELARAGVLAALAMADRVPGGLLVEARRMLDEIRAYEEEGLQGLMAQYLVGRHRPGESGLEGVVEEMLAGPGMGSRLLAALLLSHARR